MNRGDEPAYKIALGIMTSAEVMTGEEVNMSEADKVKIQAEVDTILKNIRKRGLTR